jgi:endonuclease G
MKAQWVSTGVGPGFEWNEQGATLEAVIGEPNFKAIWWLESAVRAARSVARVVLQGGSATGFLVGPDTLMTNHHVFESAADARTATLEFNYRQLADGAAAPADEWKCDPDAMFRTNPALDYSIVKVKPKAGQNAGDVWGAFNLRHGRTIRFNDRVNIIQHPQGRYQEIAFRDNKVKAVKGTFVQYLTDTDYGTSGSPVLDDWWNVVALHNQRVPDPKDPQRFHRNQGFLIPAILADAGDLIP